MYPVHLHPILQQEFFNISFLGTVSGDSWGKILGCSCSLARHRWNSPQAGTAVESWVENFSSLVPDIFACFGDTDIWLNYSFFLSTRNVEIIDNNYKIYKSHDASYMQSFMFKYCSWPTWPPLKVMWICVSMWGCRRSTLPNENWTQATCANPKQTCPQWAAALCSICKTRTPRCSHLPINMFVGRSWDVICKLLNTQYCDCTAICNL